MNLHNRVAYLEDCARRRGGQTEVEQMTDAELEALIADDLGIDEREITNELLEAMARDKG